MSASRIQRLEALLERVQDNRHKPRAAAPAPAKPPPSSSPLEAAMQDLGVVAPPPSKPSSRPPKPTPAARPSVKPEAVAQQPRKAPPKPKPVAPQRPKPVVPQAKPQAKPVKPAQPIQLEASPPQASGSVASVASKPETTKPATFGELLDRTLALRPR